MDTDGNPEKTGIYLTVLLYPEHDVENETRRMLATVDTRWFGARDSWAMEGQPEEGFVWSEESGSSWHERVYAWAELVEIGETVRLPDGVDWEI